MKARYTLECVTFELSRRCNMRCCHCLRGEAEDVDMSGRVLDAAFERLSGYDVDQIYIGGGEPTVTVKNMCNFAVKMRAHLTGNTTLFFVTNGKTMPERFIDAVSLIGSRFDVVGMMSHDEWHDRLNYKGVAKRFHKLFDRSGISVKLREEDIDAADVACEAYNHKLGIERLLAMGRGYTVLGAHHAVSIGKYYFEAYGDSSDVEVGENFYVDAYGTVWPSCDLSYDFMSRHLEYSIGSVLDPKFDWVKAARKFNRRFKDNFPLRLKEFM